MTAALDRVIDIALGQALALEHGWGNEAADPGVCASTGGALRRAVASLGAEIRWPIPEPPEGQDQPAADDTAPETVARSVDAVQRWMTADLWSSLGLDGDFNSYMDRNGFGETWAVLLGRVRDTAQGAVPCTAEKCVLRSGHRGPHYSAGDVGTSEPLPGAVTPDA
ncbi:hypothetical protein [Nocardia aurea]|uniref:hypothetical protein n=1 Tax=Nocardia aurea TaxID=2144174 RepID=UPI0033B4A006